MVKLTIAEMERKKAEMLKQLADKDREIDTLRKAPVIAKLKVLTNFSTDHFKDMSVDELQMALAIAESASTRRKGLIARQNDGFDLAETVDAYEYDPQTGRMKHVYAKEIDKAVW